MSTHLYMKDNLNVLGLGHAQDSLHTCVVPIWPCTLSLQLSCTDVTVLSKCGIAQHFPFLPPTLKCRPPFVDVFLAVHWQVHGGAISGVTRMEALHGMRPLTQTQGPFALTGSSPWEKYLTANYNPHDEVQSHRTRPPAWTLPPNRSALTAPGDHVC